MSDETLLSAARRVVRLIRIDNEQSGGLVSNETTWAVDILAQMIDREIQKQKEQKHEQNVD